jgi:hypothetical protein
VLFKIFNAHRPVFVIWLSLLYYLHTFEALEHISLYNAVKSTMSIRVDISEILNHCLGATTSGGARCFYEHC